MRARVSPSRPIVTLEEGRTRCCPHWCNPMGCSGACPPFSLRLLLHAPGLPCHRCPGSLSFCRPTEIILTLGIFYCLFLECSSPSHHTAGSSLTFTSELMYLSIKLTSSLFPNPFLTHSHQLLCPIFLFDILHFTYHYQNLSQWFSYLFPVYYISLFSTVEDLWN